MASTRKPPKNSDLLTRVTAVVKRHVRCGSRIVAGLSGGVDSVVLLDLLHRLSKTMAFDLAAVHVNHQINPAAVRWAAFCRALCGRLEIKCKVVRVNVPRGNSLEAAARHARYQVFTSTRADFVTLAHNLDDQAETVVLQLLRGAGVKGLSAMPEIRGVDSGGRCTGQKIGKSNNSELKSARHSRIALPNPAILRPLLDVPRSEIVKYARRHKLEWVEDDSNADEGFDRNFLRHQVLPLIAQRYPSYRTSLLRASRNCAEVSLLMEEIAATDVRLVDHCISLNDLRGLSAPRAKNAVRHFLAGHGVIMPNATRLDEFVRQILLCRADGHIAMALGDRQLVQFAGEIRLVPNLEAVPRSYQRAWNGEPSLTLAELGGTLKMRKCRSAGISLTRLLAAPVTVRVRQGGERFKSDTRGPHHSLKNLLREAHVPPWMRSRLPLLFSGVNLVYVPGIGVDPAYASAPGEAGIEPTWQTG